MNSPYFHRLQDNTDQDEGNAQIEREIDFATLTKDEKSEDDGVTRLKVVRQIDGKCRQSLQGLNLKQVHGYSTKERVTEHEPKIRIFRNDYNRLMTGKEPKIYWDDGRYDDEATRHLIHQHHTTANTHADFLIADGIKSTDS